MAALPILLSQQVFQKTGFLEHWKTGFLVSY